MDQAEPLRDHDIVIPWEARSPLAEDEVYIAELVGCVLIDIVSGASVGPVTGVDRESGATELLVVASERGELLVPFIKAYAPHWDLGARTLHMQLPNGLLDVPEPARAPAPAKAGKWTRKRFGTQTGKRPGRQSGKRPGEVR